jgi:hypothetical protein
MPNKLSSYKCLAGIQLFIGLAVSADPLVNSWTNPMSAPWEGGTNWSLGQFPASNQSVMITNAGYKGVGISPSMPTNFPASMTVSNLTISAPPNALSTLLLNYCGTATPLRVLNGCTIGTNGSLDNFYGAFEADSGEWSITNGQFNEEGGTTVATNATTFVVGGSMNLTNANVKLGTLFVGADTNSGTVIQAGGSGDCTLVVRSGNYSFLGGSFSGRCYVSGSSANFRQYGGTNHASISIGTDPYALGGNFGGYTLYNGVVMASGLDIGVNADGFGSLDQEGGLVSVASVDMGGISLGNFPAPRGTYSLSNGVLLAGSVGVINGGITQTGGQCTVSNSLSLSGDLEDYGPVSIANYELLGGALFCANINMRVLSYFDQSGGTNKVSGDLTFSSTYYSLSAGSLLTSNSVVAYPYFVSSDGFRISGGFVQTGGEHRVSNALVDDDQYILSGGILAATNIVLRGILSVSNSAVIVNPGLFDFGGELQLFNNANENLGQMLLSANSSIDLENSTHTLAFQNSSSIVWSNGFELTVSNWTGLTNGGGSDRLLFGNNSSGLTQVQLHQIQFANPAGFPAGLYPATMLGTGEVVPTLWQILLYSRNQTGLVLNWSGSYVLQSATNVQGPYSDMSNATSPYTIPGFQSPKEFFRLRQ